MIFDSCSHCPCVTYLKRSDLIYFPKQQQQFLLESFSALSVKAFVVVHRGKMKLRGKLPLLQDCLFLSLFIHFLNHFYLFTAQMNFFMEGASYAQRSAIP